MYWACLGWDCSNLLLWLWKLWVRWWWLRLRWLWRGCHGLGWDWVQLEGSWCVDWLGELRWLGQIGRASCRERVSSPV